MRGNRRLFVVFIALVAAVSSCKAFSGASNREEHLQSAIRSFHIGFVAHDLSYLLRYIPSEDRKKWGEAFLCYMGRYRVVDFIVQDIEPGEGSKSAQVMVLMSIHPVDSIATHEKLWIEEWKYEKKQWYLNTKTEDFREYIGSCFP